MEYFTEIGSGKYESLILLPKKKKKGYSPSYTKDPRQLAKIEKFKQIKINKTVEISGQYICTMS